MAQIDQFVAMMEKQRIQCAMLIGDNPGRIFTQGKESKGPIVKDADLERMIREITPHDLLPQLDRGSPYQFHHSCQDGVFDVGVRRQKGTLQVTFSHVRPVGGSDQDEKEDQLPKPAQRPKMASEVNLSPVLQAPTLTHDAPEYVTSQAEEEEPQNWMMLQTIGWTIFALIVGLCMVILIVRVVAPGQMSDHSLRDVYLSLGLLIFCWVGLTTYIKRTKAGFIMPPGWRLDRHSKLVRALQALPDLKAHHQWISVDTHSAILVDETSQRVGLVNLPGEGFHQEYRNKITDFVNKYKEQHNVQQVPQVEVRKYSAETYPSYHRSSDTLIRVYPFRAILESKISQDGESLDKEARTSHTGAALLRNLLRNYAEEVEGPLPDENRRGDTVYHVDIRIAINDSHYPVHVLNYLAGETRKVSLLYMPATREARKWHAIFCQIIRDCDRDDLAAELQQQKLSIANAMPTVAEDEPVAAELAPDEIKPDLPTPEAAMPSPTANFWETAPS